MTDVQDAPIDVDLSGYADLTDLTLILEPYGIDVTDIPATGGLEIIYNSRQRSQGPTFALRVKTFAKDPTGKIILNGHEPAYNVQTIAIATLPVLTPTP